MDAPLSGATLWGYYGGVGNDAYLPLRNISLWISPTEDFRTTGYPCVSGLSPRTPAWPITMTCNYTLEAVRFVTLVRPQNTLWPSLITNELQPFRYRKS